MRRRGKKRTACDPNLAVWTVNPRSGQRQRFRHRLLYLANAMVDQHIGLEETDDGVWNIHFNTVLLATLDERDYIIRG